MTEKAHDPITPGEILLEEFLIPLGISQYRLTKAIGCRRDASTRSSMASAGSHPRQGFACPALSA